MLKRCSAFLLSLFMILNSAAFADSESRPATEAEKKFQTAFC
ncbi:MAG: hypothetical protein PWR01_4066 [Clostridiales bacterium]|jgi:hypothetical protein|nr:hypothetical protein [Clostridiales bacterium]MDN5282993.1 hypothetical protein [Candidatus Ozemobacter sp.]